MDTDDILRAHEERIRGLENTARKHEGDIAKLADKTESAWHTIRETKDDVTKISTKVDELDKNVKTILDTQAATDKRIEKIEDGMAAIQKDNAEIKQDSKISKSQQKFAIVILKIILAVVAFLAVANIIFFIYIWTHNSELAKEILSFGSDVVKTVT